MGDSDLSPTPRRTSPASPLRIAVCGRPGDGLRTLLGALGGAGDDLEVIGADHQAIGAFAFELLGGPAVACGLVLLDASAGIRRENVRDARLLAALGIRDLVVVLNKMDLVDFSEARFAELVTEVRAIATGSQVESVSCIPVSALHGDNVRTPSPRLAFAGGVTLAGQLETHRPTGLIPVPAAQDMTLEEADGFQVTIAWTAAEPLLRGRAYTLLLDGQQATATVAPIKYRLDMRSAERLAAVQLEAGEIGCCVLELSEPVRFAPHSERAEAGTFTLIDRVDERKVGIGIIDFALRRSQNVRWQTVTVDKEARSRSLRQQPCVLWLTGLSGAGKSTIANIVEAELHSRGHQTYLLDGDNVRHGLNADLGFSAADRVENIRRVGEVAALMVDAGMIVLVSFISPFRAERRMARSLVHEDEFIEVFIDTPLAVAEQRDPKGLYEKARSGELTNFTGIDSPYEPPENPEIRIDTTASTPVEAARQIVAELELRGRLGTIISAGIRRVS